MTFRNKFNYMYINLRFHLAFCSQNFIYLFQVQFYLPYFMPDFIYIFHAQISFTISTFYFLIHPNFINHFHAHFLKFKYNLPLPCSNYTYSFNAQILFTFFQVRILLTFFMPKFIDFFNSKFHFLLYCSNTLATALLFP